MLSVPHQQSDKQFIVGKIMDWWVYPKGHTSLWEAKGRGKKATWKEEDWEAVEKWLSEDRSYSARQLSQKLAQEKQIKLGAEQVRRILVKKNGVGKG